MHARSRLRRALGVGIAAVAVTAMTAPALAAPPDRVKPNQLPKPHKQASYPVDAEYTDTWTRADAEEMELTESNTLPLWDEIPVEPWTDEVWIWDTWPLTNLDGRTVNYKGYRILFSLTADHDLPFVERHWTAEIGYSISRDGRSWDYQGDLFPADVEPPGDREWAGSTILVGDRVYVFYTASGVEGVTDENDPRYSQQEIAMTSAQINAGPDGVWFSDWTDHEIILRADGEWYQTLEQSVGPIIYGFRDPWVFRNPEDGEIYMLFEGNTAGGAVECLPENIGEGATEPIDPQAVYFNGNIGLAAGSDDLTSWELLPPVMNANCMNQQLERPHATFRGGLVYLWTISHTGTFAPNLRDIPDGLFGFVGPSIRSDYIPLNGSGLVLANPPENVTQSYSWYAMPGGFVEAFIDNVEGEYVGTLTPTVKLSFPGQVTTKITNIFDSAFIP